MIATQARASARTRPGLYVVLPVPHDLQAEIEASPAKRKVVVTGRRFGKTVLAARMAVLAMMAGKRVLYAAPKADQTEAFWEAVRLYLGELIEAGLIAKNETKLQLIGRVAGIGRIRAKTAWDADGLRGDHADLLILDEYAFMKPNAWSKVGAPMLADNDGDAVFFTTPNRRNHAYIAFMRGQQDATGRWRSWSAPSVANPHLTPEVLAELATDMTEEDARQELGAEFLPGEGAVFGNIDANLYAGGDTPEMHAGHWVVAGQDWGKQKDYSASSIVCATCKKELELIRFRRDRYKLQRKRLAIAWHRWGVKSILAEANSMGTPIIEELQDEGWPVEPFDTTPSSKPPLIESLKLTLERVGIMWLDDSVAKAELEAYEGKQSPRTGRMSYSAPEGVHDDTVIARALANRAVNLGVLQVGRMYD